MVNQPELFQGPQNYPLEQAAAPGPRQRRPAKPRSGSSRNSGGFLGKLFPASLWLGIVILAAWSGFRYARSSPTFRLADVHLRGGQFVAPSEVEEKFLEDRGGGLLQVPLEERRREIEQIAWVRSATLTRVLPNHLWVTVEERVPVAFVWTSGGIALVDEEGVLLDRPPESSFTFPVARGISGRDSAAERRLRMQLFNGLIKELDAAALLPGEEISEVDLTDPQDVRVVVADASGAVQLHLGADQFRERYWVYAQNIRQWQRKFPSIESIDLRYEGQAVLNAGQRQSATVPNKTSGAPPASRPISQPRPETADGSGLAQPSR